MNLETQKSNQPLPLPRRNDNIFYPESDGKPMAETDIHRKLLLYLTSCLELFFENREKVYVTGNIMFYYEEGSPDEVVSPDVMVFFGVNKGNRTSYKTWEENDVLPSVIIELASRSTWHKDRTEKRELYEMMGVKEYYIFNPLYPKTLPAFLAFGLESGVLVKQEIQNNRIYSEQLGLELVDTGETLRIYDLDKNEFLKNQEELDQEVKHLDQEIKHLSNEVKEKTDENIILKAEIERLTAIIENKNL
jgi:Uma2 family endonuclease